MNSLNSNATNVEKRTEEVQDIIERMPTNFGFLVTGIILFIFTLLLVFGWVIRYPDVVRGEIVINSNLSPVKLVASANGKLKFVNNLKSAQKIKEGEIIAYIDNAADLNKVLLLDTLLKKYNPSSFNVSEIKSRLPLTLSLGELNGKYFGFINSLQEQINYEQDRLLDKQQFGLQEVLIEQYNIISISKRRVEMSVNSLNFAHKFFSKDSLLYINKVLSEAEYDKSQMNYNTSKDNYQNYLNNLLIANQQYKNTSNKIQEIQIQSKEKEKEVKTNVITALNDLIDNIKIWEQKYIFRAPFDGNVQFIKFWSNNQYIQYGEQIFSIIPKNEKAIGQVILPAYGAGKVEIGQEAIIKLDDYPFNEYGSVKGIVKTISLTNNTVRTDKGDVNNYLVIVDFPKKLKTNYGTELNFKFESKGSAEIITNDRRLIERLFSNLKYLVK